MFWHPASSHSSQYEELQSQTEPVGRTVWPGGNTYMCFGFLQTKETLDGLKMCTCVVVWESKRRSDKSKTRKLQRCQTSQRRPQNWTGRKAMCMDRIDYAKTRKKPREQVRYKTWTSEIVGGKIKFKTQERHWKQTHDGTGLQREPR